MHVTAFPRLASAPESAHAEQTGRDASTRGTHKLRRELVGRRAAEEGENGAGRVQIARFIAVRPARAACAQTQ